MNHIEIEIAKSSVCVDQSLDQHGGREFEQPLVLAFFFL
jgi:hypothetical protein